MTTLVAALTVLAGLALLFSALRALVPGAARLCLVALAGTAVLPAAVAGGDLARAAGFFGAAAAVTLLLRGMPAPVVAAFAAAGALVSLPALASVLVAAARVSSARRRRALLALAVLAAGAVGFSTGAPAAALWGSRGGVLFWTPLLWVAALGVRAWHRRDPAQAEAFAAAGLCAVALAATEPPAGPAAQARFAAVLAPLSPLLAAGLQVLRAGAERRPMAALSAAIGLAMVWNFALMHQYRAQWIPRDDTVAFPRLVENGARAVSAAVGAPVTWPGSWVGAAMGIPLPRFEAVLERVVARDGPPVRVVMADPADADALLGPGWGVRERCGATACRTVAGRAEVLLPLRRPAPVVVTLQAESSGTVTLEKDARALCVLSLPATPSCAIPAAALGAGVNVLALATSAPVLVRAIVFSPARLGDR